MGIKVRVNNSIESVFNEHYTAYYIHDLNNDIELSDDKHHCDKVIVDNEDLSATYLYDKDTLTARILSKLSGKNISSKDVDDNNVLSIDLHDGRVHVLSSYGDAAQHGEDFFFTIAYVFNNFVYVTDVTATGVCNDKLEFEVNTYISSSKLPVGVDALGGKAPYYMYRQSGISLRIDDNEIWNSVPDHFKHTMAKDWSTTRLFLLMEQH